VIRIGTETSKLQSDWDAVRDEIEERIAVLKMPKLNWNLIAERPQPPVGRWIKVDDGWNHP
jgi:hypothetical protein